MKNIFFSKMHGLGNDFVVINTLNQAIDLDTSTIKQLSHRQLGIGFDQLLLVVPASNADFFCRIFNADGSEAEQCGNGLRCVAQFIYQQGLTKQPSFTIATQAGVFPATVLSPSQVAVTLSIPDFNPVNIPLDLTHTEVVSNTPLLFKLPDVLVQPLIALSMGNPHVIIPVPSVDTASISTLGPKIAGHPAFPQSTNVGFMEIIDSKQIRLRTYERGSGETFACGSNACAAAVVAMLTHSMATTVTVHLPLGSLRIHWPSLTDGVQMAGPTATVFTGTILLA